MAENTLTSVAPSGFGWKSYAAGLYPNLESFPGQVMTTPMLQSAKEEGRKSRKDVVRAARAIERTSELIRGGIDKKVDYTVGPRLRIHPRPDFEMLGITDPDAQDRLTRSMNREFRNWAYDTRFLQDGEGHCDFGGLMWQSFRGVAGADGETALVIHFDEKRARDYGARWATYVTIVDPDRIDTPPKYVGNPRIYDGIVTDPDGRRIGFFVQKNHPSDQMTDAADLEFTLVPRETKTGRPVGVHFFVKRRPSQLRGISTLVTVIKQTGMVDKYDDAYLAAAIISQLLATWIESPAPTEQVAEALNPAGDDTDTSVTGFMGQFYQKLDYYDKTKLRIGANRMVIMPPGDKIHMETAAKEMLDPGPLRDGFLRMISSAVGISFEQLAQRFGDSNFSAARAAFTDAFVGILRERYLFGIAVPAQVYAAVIEEAWVKGRLDLPANAPDFYENRTAYTSCDCTGPGMPQVDPQKEANADKINLENKTTSRQKIAAARGDDYIDIFDQIAKERAEAEERGFTLDPLAPGTPGAEAATAGQGVEDEEIAALAEEK